METPDETETVDDMIDTVTQHPDAWTEMVSAAAEKREGEE